MSEVYKGGEDAVDTEKTQEHSILDRPISELNFGELLLREEFIFEHIRELDEQITEIFTTSERRDRGLVGLQDQIRAALRDQQIQEAARLADVLEERGEELERLWGEMGVLNRQRRELESDLRIVVGLLAKKEKEQEKGRVSN